MRQRGGNNALNQCGVYMQRQVRAVLLNGCHRQDRNAARQIQAGEVRAFQVSPEAGQGRGVRL